MERPSVIGPGLARLTKTGVPFIPPRRSPAPGRRRRRPKADAAVAPPVSPATTLRRPARLLIADWWADSAPGPGAGHIGVVGRTRRGFANLIHLFVARPQFIDAGDKQT